MIFYFDIARILYIMFLKRFKKFKNFYGRNSVGFNKSVHCKKTKNPKIITFHEVIKILPNSNEFELHRELSLSVWGFGAWS